MRIHTDQRVPLRLLRGHSSEQGVRGEVRSRRLPSIPELKKPVTCWGHTRPPEAAAGGLLGCHVLCLKGRGHTAAQESWFEDFLAQPFVGQTIGDAGTPQAVTERQEENQKVKYEKPVPIKQINSHATSPPSLASWLCSWRPLPHLAPSEKKSR